MDEAKLEKQFQYLRMLKALNVPELRKVHKEIFPKGHRFYAKIPTHMHRSIIERRLFYYFAAGNYHFPNKHPLTKEFRRKARHILSNGYVNRLDEVEEAQQAVRDLKKFSKTNIRNMTVIEVDRYLTSLGLYIKASEATRRKVLWEWFNKASGDLILRKNKLGKQVRTHRKSGTQNNQLVLRDLILEYPSLPYQEFVEMFGDEMPTVTRASYNNQRSILRKAGYDIPRLKKGSQNPTVVKDKNGLFTRGRTINTKEI